MKIQIESDNNQPNRWGMILLQGLVLFLFCFLGLRFWYLQILMGENFERSAHANRWKEEKVYANRGLIFDDKGNILAENSPAYALALVREDCKDIPATLAQVSRWTGVPLASIQEAYDDGIKTNPKSFMPLILVPNISFDQLLYVESASSAWPGITILSRQRRYYMHGNLFAHVLGYVSLANSKDHETFPELDTGDTVGKQGLEVMLENRLRGTKGENSIEVDVHGRQLNKEVKQPPRGGEDIRLSLDLNLQEAATKALGDNAGCIVVMEPDTGKLRALVTAPSYDNNIFTGRLSAADWSKLRDDERHPLQNRVIQSVYPPGSVWKLMVVGALLENGVSPNETVFCPGSVTLGNRVFRCWRKGGHGTVNMTNSLVWSCDVYFYLMADRIGIDKLSAYAKKCGFGSKTGIDLPSEKAGLVPSREWKKANFKDGWQRGETYNTSIGQGYTLVTPVQIAVYVSSLMNGGILYKPLLIDTDDPVVMGHTPATAAQRDFIMEGMRQTVSSPTGTARRIARADAIMGGKTGTAQVVRIGDRRLKAHEMDYKHRDHAWFTGWGMKNNRRYVVVVMVEHGGGGASAAGPICNEVFNYLFDEDGPDHESNILKTETVDARLPEDASNSAVDQAIQASQAWSSND